MEDQHKRLNKYIGETGYCSRREADELIAAGRVTVNGKIPEMGTKVTPQDEVRIDGKRIRDNSEKLIYLAFNKPVGIECTTNLQVRNNIIDYINYPIRIFPIGRLDKASEGLIFLTNDGDIVNKILRARNNHEKEYIVTVDKPISERFIKRMSEGIPILGTVTRKCHVEVVSKYVFKIILTQGLNRQIRRMCEFLDYEVKALKRVRIINIHLDVPVGRYRELTETEIKQLQQLIEPSSKTEEASLPKAKDSETVRHEPRKRNLEARVNSGRERRELKKNPEEKPQTEKRNPFAAKKADQTPKQNRTATEGSDNQPKASRWKVDFIKKDDPNYRKKGEY